jgi:hypothetical protein
VNALTDPQVGRYLNRHFVSAYQKVATFQLNGAQKQGGNVASYFCTANGLVLHAVAGPTDSGTFLREARWANDTYQMAQLSCRTPAELQSFFRRSHLDRLQREHNLQLSANDLPPPEEFTGKMLERFFVLESRQVGTNQGKVHLLLALGPTLPLAQVYRIVFERILNERISTSPVAVTGR